MSWLYCVFSLTIRWERPHISGEPVVAMDSIPGPPDQSQWVVHRLTQSILEKIPFERDKHPPLPEKNPLDLGHVFYESPYCYKSFVLYSKGR